MQAEVEIATECGISINVWREAGFSEMAANSATLCVQLHTTVLSVHTYKPNSPIVHQYHLVLVHQPDLGVPTHTQKVERTITVTSARSVTYTVTSASSVTYTVTSASSVTYTVASSRSVIYVLYA